MRKAILAAAESPLMQRGIRRHGMRLGASRFVAGETLDQAVGVLRDLNARGLKLNTTLLGEGVRDEAETRAVVDSYKVTLDRIAAEQLRVNVALKLTHLGLTFDEELARTNIGELVAHAGRLGNFVRLDMEQSSLVDATFRVMLYGVRGKLQLDLVQQGFDVLVATPYGPDWYRYLMRRLAERPASILFIARSLVRR